MFGVCILYLYSRKGAPSTALHRLGLATLPLVAVCVRVFHDWKPYKQLRGMLAQRSNAQVSFISIYCVTQYYTILMTHFNDLNFSSSHHRESSSGCRRFISKCFRSFSLCGPSLCYASCCCLTVCWPLLRACRTACDGALPPRISCDERIATR